MADLNNLRQREGSSKEDFDNALAELELAILMADEAREKWLTATEAVREEELRQVILRAARN